MSTHIVANKRLIIANENIITSGVIQKYWEDNNYELPPPSCMTAASISPLIPEKDRIAFALEQCRQNRTRAAEILGMDRTTLYRKPRNYGFDVRKP
jgi:DNA-binding NtrC family response regulator